MVEPREQVKSAIDTAADKGKSAADWVAEKAQTGKETAGEMVDNVAARAQKAARAFADGTVKVKDKVVDWATDASAPVQEFAADAYSESKDAVAKLGKNLTEAVRAYPITAIAIGFGLGLVLGRAANRS